MVSDEQGERFHKEIAFAQTRFKGRAADTKMLADYCWLIQTEDKAKHTRKSRSQKRFNQ